jgi:hypothetical protein
VFRRCRYDNLTSSVKKILQGHEREQTVRFIAFRSHWKFEAQFCTPREAHEKGGVEGEIGYFRRNHWVPVPKAKDFEELNQQLLQACQQDQQRWIGDRTQSVGVGMQIERASLLPLAPHSAFPTISGTPSPVSSKVPKRLGWQAIHISA